MEERFTRIEDYLDGRLDEAGRAAFEAELATDPELAQLLALAREARERLARHWAAEDADRALNTTLKRLGKQHFNSPAAARPWLVRRWPQLAAAAAVAALLIWVAWPAGETRLYARYREFPEAAFVVRSTEPGQAELAEATAAFNEGDFAKALPVLEKYSQTHPDDREIRFFLALCQLELGRTQEAVTGLRQISNTPNSWAGEARWFLALAYLKEKNRAQCAVVLRSIPSGGAHFEEAQELLKKVQ